MPRQCRVCVGGGLVLNFLPVYCAAVREHPTHLQTVTSPRPPYPYDQRESIPLCTFYAPSNMPHPLTLFEPPEHTCRAEKVGFLATLHLHSASLPCPWLLLLISTGDPSAHLRTFLKVTGVMPLRMGRGGTVEGNMG